MPMTSRPVFGPPASAPASAAAVSIPHPGLARSHTTPALAAASVGSHAALTRPALAPAPAPAPAPTTATSDAWGRIAVSTVPAGAPLAPPAPVAGVPHGAEVQPMSMPPDAPRRPDLRPIQRSHSYPFPRPSPAPWSSVSSHSAAAGSTGSASTAGASTSASTLFFPSSSSSLATLATPPLRSDAAPPTTSPAQAFTKVKAESAARRADAHAYGHGPAHGHTSGHSHSHSLSHAPSHSYGYDPPAKRLRRTPAGFSPPGPNVRTGGAERITSAPAPSQTLGYETAAATTAAPLATPVPASGMHAWPGSAQASTPATASPSQPPMDYFSFPSTNANTSGSGSGSGIAGTSSALSARTLGSRGVSSLSGYSAPLASASAATTTPASAGAAPVVAPSAPTHNPGPAPCLPPGPGPGTAMRAASFHFGSAGPSDGGPGAGTAGPRAPGPPRPAPSERSRTDPQLPYAAMYRPSMSTYQSSTPNSESFYRPHLASAIPQGPGSGSAPSTSYFDPAAPPGLVEQPQPLPQTPLGASESSSVAYDSLRPVPMVVSPSEPTQPMGPDHKPSDGSFASPAVTSQALTMAGPGPGSGRAYHSGVPEPVGSTALPPGDEAGYLSESRRWDAGGAHYHRASWEGPMQSQHPPQPPPPPQQGGLGGLPEQSPGWSSHFEDGSHSDWRPSYHPSGVPPSAAPGVHPGVGSYGGQQASVLAPGPMFSLGPTSSVRTRMRPKVPPVLVDGKKRHPCGWPGCTLTFSTTGHAGRHWKTTHGALKRFRCLFRNCNSRFTRQDNSLAHYREKHVEAARQRMDSLLAPHVAEAEARGATFDPLGMMIADIPGLQQAAEDFRRGYIALNSKKAIGILDEELILTQGVDQVVRRIGQPYKRAPPVPIPGLPAPGTKEDDIDPDFNVDDADGEQPHGHGQGQGQGQAPTSLHAVPIQAVPPVADLFGGTEVGGLAQTQTWSSAHPIPPIPPLRRPDERSSLLSDTKVDLRAARPRR